MLTGGVHTTCPIFDGAGCTDIVGWADSGGDTCIDYASCFDGGWVAKEKKMPKFYDRFATNGISARTACCHCGGGQRAGVQPCNPTSSRHTRAQCASYSRRRPVVLWRASCSHTLLSAHLRAWRATTPLPPRTNTSRHHHIPSDYNGRVHSDRCTCW